LPSANNDTSVRDLLGSSPEVCALVATLDAEGVERTGVALVGGVVRDLMLGRELVDLDIVVEGDGIEVARHLSDRLDAVFHAYESFGTASVRHPERTYAGIARLDIATARRERYEAPGALPTVEPSSLEHDLARRDFAINAMAVRLDPERFGELLDPFGGRADLEAGVVRVLHPRSFTDDPTRIFRAVRYAARYGMVLDIDTEQLALEAIDSGALVTVGPARVWHELLLILHEATAPVSLSLMDSLGIRSIFGEHLAFDEEVLERVAVVDGWRQRLALIVDRHDAESVRTWCSRLGITGRDADVVAAHVHALASLPEYASTLEHADNRTLHSVFGDMSDETIDLLDSVTTSDTVRTALDRYREDVQPLRLEIDGRDVLRLGAPRGPLVGEILDRIYQLKLEGIAPSREDELDAVRGLLQEVDAR
jgi:tRNA nucleotidyltransferase (CCA-adding enzyme)